ncbi:hypothetical protein GCM10022251_62690 [Phytohabitans flavus]|uniref:Uncharacterized protein n=1 Tax=Phytohabitans flavus TaxID=1076124 RepID=A0A6F8Y5A5_9ACTN|nr:hypothetical protein [Phytohabitans flavus]BCB81240.1 hypothetical protein Pflav_076500 [Phytohabitans flavus]
MGSEFEADGPRRRFEDRLHDLRGRRLTAVDYWDVHNFGPEPAPWDYGDWHHAVMGVELGTSLGFITVTWTSTFHPYGVEVFLEPIENHLVLGTPCPQRVGPDAGAMGPWAPLLGSPICGAAVHWERIQIGSSRRADGSIAAPSYAVDVPVALRLDFAAAAVWFVAGIPQLPDLRTVFIPGDEIMVVFSDEKMRDIGLYDPMFLQAPADQTGPNEA